DRNRVRVEQQVRSVLDDAAAARAEGGAATRNRVGDGQTAVRVERCRVNHLGGIRGDADDLDHVDSIRLPCPVHVRDVGLELDADLRAGPPAYRFARNRRTFESGHRDAQLYTFGDAAVHADEGPRAQRAQHAGWRAIGRVDPGRGELAWPVVAVLRTVEVR